MGRKGLITRGVCQGLGGVEQLGAAVEDETRVFFYVRGGVIELGVDKVWVAG